MSIELLEVRLRSRPDDLASWLVYGDWLSDRGDVRGRLIALEHRKARGGLSPDEARAIEREIAAIYREHRQAWGAGEAQDDALVWKYGFIIGVRLTLSEGAVAYVRTLLQQPDGRFLSSLELRCSQRSFEDEDYEAYDDEDDEDDEEEESEPEADELLPLLERLLSLDLSALRSLDLGYLDLGDPGAQALAACPRLCGLTSLDLKYNGLGSKGLAALADARPLGGLTALRLQRNRIGAKGARALARSPYLRKLAHLDLRYNPLGEEGAQALADSPNVAGLATLSLYREDVGTEGARALAWSEHLPVRLRRYWMGQ